MKTMFSPIQWKYPKRLYINWYDLRSSFNRFSNTMWNKIKSKNRHWTAWRVACIFFLFGCASGTTTPHIILNKDQWTPVVPQGSNQNYVVHPTGSQSLHIVHGKDCVSWSLGSLFRCGLRTSVPLPPQNFKEALVVLNGWDFRFKDEETEISGFGLALDKPTITSMSTVEWETFFEVATEEIQNVSACYWYTLIAWTDSLPDAHVFYEPLGPTPIRWPSNMTGLAKIPRYFQDPMFDAEPFVGTLPRGFGFQWSDDNRDPDYFLQAAYHLQPSERFVLDLESPAAQPPNEFLRRAVPSYTPPPQLLSSFFPFAEDRFGDGFVSWESEAIFKNGDAPDPYWFMDIAAGLTGSNFDLIRPHFGIEPIIQKRSAEDFAYKTTIHVSGLDNFDIAIPVLTGWNLYLPVDDEQVRQFGVRVDGFDLSKVRPLGRLSYDLAHTFDDDESSKAYCEFGVSILLIKNVPD